MEKSVDNDFSESEPVVNPQPHNDRSRSWTGCLFGFLAAITTSFGSLILKITDEHKVLMVLTRLMFQFIMLMPVVQYKKVGVVGKTRKIAFLLLVRGLLTPIISICLALALSYLSLGDTSAIFYTNPAFTVFFACICLKGKISNAQSIIISILFFC